MAHKSAAPIIRLRGVRHNNLKNFDLDLPLRQLIVITGLSGSGKSSLAFDTLFAEGQRRYIETFSPYARQFFDRMDKPQVDSIEGIPPAIAIEQRNSVKSTRSTVGTMTEICDYLKLLWPQIAQLHCRQCGREVHKDSPRQIWDTIATSPPDGNFLEHLITFDVPLTEKLSLEESLALIGKQGYQRLLIGDQITRIDDAREPMPSGSPKIITVIQDRLKPVAANRARFVEACEQAYHYGKGRLALRALASPQLPPLPAQPFSNRLHCAHCDLEYREPSPALFSFNHPVGACPACRGFGRIITIDHNLALPDRSRTLAEGVVKPWLTGQSAECQDDLIKFCKIRKVSTDVPFRELPKKWQNWVIDGDPDYGKDKQHRWPRAWYGLKGYFRWLESKAYKMHVRVLLSRYRSYLPCPSCHGQRFQPDTLLYRVAVPDAPDGGSRIPPTLTLADFYTLPIRDALHFVESLAAKRHPKPNDPLTLALNEVRSRLHYLDEVGLGYLTLDRSTRSLSGGETERVNLTTCLGTRLVNTLFVLDEPSVGLHPRDTDRLVRILERLRDAGNTVVVVEHEASVMRAANQIIDLGPGHGASGGQVVFQGPYREILKSRDSLTGQYLSDRQQILVPARRGLSSPQNSHSQQLADAGKPPGNRRTLSPSPTGWETAGAWRVPHAGRVRAISDSRSTAASQTLTITHANIHNLQDLTVDIPLDRLVCITGVSGSGKTTLVRDVLQPLLNSKFAVQRPAPHDNESDDSPSPDTDTPASAPSVAAATLRGWEALGSAVLVDQTALAKTPRSNPAVYTGAFDEIRELFAQSEVAQQRGLNASAFSFNSTQGQCERCRGAGFEKIEMQFLSDVFIRCPECDGRRYRPHILEIKIMPQERLPKNGPSPLSPDAPSSSSDPQASSSLVLREETAGAWGVPHAGQPRVLPAEIAHLEPFSDARTPDGKRPHTREYPLSHRMGEGSFGFTRSVGTPSTPHPNTKSIADVLDSTVDEAVEFLAAFGNTRSAVRALAAIKLLQEVGLGYLKLGQPINTLSGGESQRLKLVRHLAEFPQSEGTDAKPTLFLFDEPTTGLHFDDVRVLLKVFQRLVDAGHSVIIIEHNLDVIKSADWVIDLGPDAGDAGGRIVAQGTPEQIAACPESHTGQALKEVLPAPKPADKLPEPALPGS